MSKRKKTVEPVEETESPAAEQEEKPDSEDAPDGRENLTESVGDTKIDDQAGDPSGEPAAVVEDVAGEIAANGDEVPDEPERAEDAADAGADIEEVVGGPGGFESVEQAKSILEALLFASGEPMTARKLANAVGGVKAKEVESLLRQLGEDLKREGRGIQVLEVAGGFQLSTRPEFADWVMRLLGHKRRSPLSQAALETLAIVAYKQPIIRADVDAIRGVESSGVIRTLLDLELIDVKGRKDVLGKPQLYGTTDGFLRVFGLRKLDDLPSIQELRERYNATQLHKNESEGKSDDSDQDKETAPEETGESAPENAAVNEEKDDSSEDLVEEEPVETMPPSDTPTAGNDDEADDSREAETPT